jgi:hypothetical protein
MPDPELEQIYRDAGFMIDACAESRRECVRQRELLSAQRERLTESRERRVEWEDKRARADEQLYDSLKNG